MDDRLRNQSQTFRVSVLSGISLVLTFIALFLAVFDLVHQHQYWLACGECLLSLYSGFIYIRIKQKRYSKRHILYYAYYLIFILALGTYTQPFSQGFFLWSCFAPITLYLLLGISHGIYSTGIFLIIQSLLIMIKLGQQSPGYDSLSMVFNLILSYCSIWLISHLYESHRAQIEDSLIYLASRDSLTGAHNRLSLVTLFHQLTQNKKPDEHLSLLILDIDYFKQINDQFGHDIGDKVLIETSILISRLVGDDNLFRIGGEEFCITLIGKDLEEANSVGELLRNTVSNHLFRFGENQLQLTLSIGICPYCNGDNLSDILKLADIELYKAKQNGRNQVRICRQMPYSHTKQNTPDSI